MALKRLIALVLALLALAACAGPTVQTVARVDNVILTRQELDQRVARRLGASNGQAAPGQSTQDVERQIVNLFLQQNLVLSLARQRGIQIQEQEVDAQIEQFRSNVALSGGALDDIVRSELGFSGADSTEFRQFVASFLAQQRLGESLVSDADARQQITDEIMQQANTPVEQVHAAHILVGTAEEAQAVLDRLAAGETFEDLAKELSLDPGSGANGGDLGWVPRGRFVPEFEQAVFDQLQPGEVTQTPVQTQFGYHVIKLLERAERPMMTEDEARQVIEQSLEQQVGQQRQLALQQLLEEERAKAEREGRLEAPEYADPAAAP